jgi:hypothetical protein
MKKILIWGGLSLVVLAILAVIAVGLLLDKAIKAGVETYGPQITKVDVKLDAASLSLLSGGGSIRGFVLGNPPGYSTPAAIRVESTSLSLKPSSLLSDKIVVRSINVQAPEITFETAPGGETNQTGLLAQLTALRDALQKNNLNQILRNIQETTGGGKEPGAAPPRKEPARPAAPAKKLQVDDFVLSGARLHLSSSLLGKKPITLSLPDIHLSGLGTGPEGITGSELARQVAQILSDKAIEAVGKEMTKSGPDALQSAGANLKNSQDLKDLSGAAKNVKDLFKSKK